MQQVTYSPRPQTDDVGYADPGPGRALQAGHRAEGPPMRQIQISKRQRPARWQREPLPPDARDPDIARAKQLARRARRPQRQPLHT
jgi:hypothetical protein